MLPKHLKTVPPDRKAIAPYNFVELPDKVVEVEKDSLPKHDCYYIDRHTSRIECTLTTSSPLYIRCGLTKEQFKNEEEFKDKPEFFYTDEITKNPVLPGSSLRGMLRTMVEIVSFSKIERVSDQQRFFFRAVAADRDEPLKAEYAKHIRNVKAGYLKKDLDDWLIHPARTTPGTSFVWVRERDLELSNFPTLIKMDQLGYLPQYIPVSFEIVQKNRNNRYFAKNVSIPSAYPENTGILVTSGNMKKGDDSLTSTPRRNHCIVLDPSSNSELLRIDKTAIQHYCNALTDFQQDAPFDRTLGVLAEDRPVFYCQPQPGKPVTLFGQSPNFRIPYPQSNGEAASAVDFIPSRLRNSETTDLADAIFGFVRGKKQQEGQQQARAGRIFITDGICKKAVTDSIWFTGKTITPKILASPKPTTFQHYLVQTSSKKQDLKHYASQPEQETVIRGHKLYWHKGESPAIQHENPDDVSETQKTEIKPIKPGVNFHFTIYFENLSDVELGALLCVLDIAQDDNYRLSLGMGKPLGMGAVKINHKLYLSNRQQRYTKLFSNNNWDNGESLNTQPNYITIFQSYVLKEIELNENFREIERIQMLLTMLSWQNIPSAENTRYLEIERQRQQLDGVPNEYKTRRILPTPLQIVESLKHNRSTAKPLRPNQNQESSHQSNSLHSKPSETQKSSQVEFPKVSKVKKLSVGQIIEAIVVDITTKVIDNRKTKTTITYEVDGVKLGKAEEVYKKSVSLAIGNIVKLRVIEIKDGSIKKFERIE